MGYIIVGVIVIIVLIALVYLRARSIVKRHAVTLSHITGIPAEQIAREMVNGNMTPGQWAASHGLNPMTFQPESPGARDLDAWAEGPEGYWR